MKLKTLCSCPSRLETKEFTLATYNSRLSMSFGIIIYAKGHKGKVPQLLDKLYMKKCSTENEKSLLLMDSIDWVEYLILLEFVVKQ